jgi:choline kinase
MAFIGQTLAGMVLLPFFWVGMTCNLLHSTKNDINNYISTYYKNKELLLANPDHCIPYSSLNTFSNALKENIYVLNADTKQLEKATKQIHLKTGKVVYVSEKSNRLIWPADFSNKTNAITC